MKYLDRATGEGTNAIIVDPGEDEVEAGFVYINVCCGNTVEKPPGEYDDYEVIGQCPGCNVTWELERVCIECDKELPEGYQGKCLACGCDLIMGIGSHAYYECE